MELMKMQKKIDVQFFETTMTNTRQPFYYFIGTHPHFYDGIDIDTATINAINNFFYEWEVNPLHFEHRFTTILLFELGRYNNIKDIELSKKITSILTRRSSKQIIDDAIRDVRTEQETKSKQSNKSKSENNGDTISDSIDAENNDSKTANRELPMESSGRNFDAVVEWGHGASNISESRNDSENKNNTKTTAKSTTTQDDKIRKEDASQIAELEKKLINNQETYEEIQGQAVILIRNIIKYLYEPKAINYLIDKLKDSFYSVY